MDWAGISRLAPEAGILVIAGWFSFKQSKLHQETIERIDDRHHEALDKLSDAIEKKLTPAVEKVSEESKINTEVTKELKNYLVNLNGELRSVARKKRNVK